jgi:hypothetical protein
MPALGLPPVAVLQVRVVPPVAVVTVLGVPNRVPVQVVSMTAERSTPERILLNEKSISFVLFCSSVINGSKPLAANLSRGSL